MELGKTLQEYSKMTQPPNKQHTLMITGGAGFIGSHVTRLFVSKYPGYKVLNLDSLTYAGNLENLKDVESAKNYQFIRGDIRDEAFVRSLFSEYPISGVIHLAAESHVDRSISDPMEFLYTNVIGTGNLLIAARDHWKDAYEGKMFFQVSTDEVYGSLGAEGYFTEETPYDPRSPYSASKASADHLVRAYHNTYGLPVLLTNCSNNYGPNQFPEKLIPLMIRNIQADKPLPIYGKGENVRDWLYVEDHAHAIDLVYHHGGNGSTYNIGGMNEWKNIDLVRKLCAIMDRKLNRPPGSSDKLIRFVQDRAGHDLRYAIDCSRLTRELGWKPLVDFEKGLEITVDWYLSNQEWMEHVISGEYEKYYEKQYFSRLF
jgi:dTDP-glucose 4,6-dehydratase